LNIEQASNKVRISIEQGTKMVWRLYEENTDKMLMDSGRSILQSLTLNRQVSDF